MLLSQFHGSGTTRGAFAVPGMKTPGMTRFMVFTGEGTPFGGSEGPEKKPAGPQRHRIMFVQAGADKEVPWSKPEDLPFLPKDPVASLGDLKESFFLAAFFDGNIYILPTDMEPDILRRLIRPEPDRPVAPKDWWPIMEACRERVNKELPPLP